MNILKKIILSVIFNNKEKERILDCYRYLLQYERSIYEEKNRIFCMDISLCRKMLVDIIGGDSELYKDIHKDMKNHANYGRYSEQYEDLSAELNDDYEVDCCGLKMR